MPVTSIGLFPHASLPAPRVANDSIDVAFSDTLVGPFDSGREVVLQKSRTSICRFSVTWSRACWNDFRPLVKWFARARRTKLFTFIAWPGAGFAVDSRNGWEEVYVAVVDDDVTTGSDTYEMPFLEYDDSDEDHLALYLNEELIDPSEYTLEASGAGTGTDGRIMLTFADLTVLLEAVSDGKPALLTVSGLFAMACWARFTSPVLTRNPTVGYIVDIQTGITEVRVQTLGSLRFP